MNDSLQQTNRHNEREKNRILLLFYDSIALILVWAIVLVMHPSMPAPISTPTLIINLVASFACLTSFRFIFRVYRRILRTGAIGTFARDIAACLLGSAVYVILGRIVPVLSIPFTAAIAFMASYTLFCLLMRITYYYLYRFAKLDTPVSRWVKKALIALTLVDFNSNEEGGLLRVVLESAEHSSSPINEIQNIIEKFAIRGDVTSIVQIKKGYINRTYRVETLSDTGHVHKYLLQRINTNVFPDVDALMDNFQLTTGHLYGRYLLPGHAKKGSVQTMRRTKDGRSYYRDDSGSWRMVTYFDGVYSLDIPDSLKTFYYAGRAFGKFVKEMADVDLEDVKVVIPNFHNTRSRYNVLEQAIAWTDLHAERVCAVLNTLPGLPPKYFRHVAIAGQMHKTETCHAVSATLPDLVRRFPEDARKALDALLGADEQLAAALGAERAYGGVAERGGYGLDGRLSWAEAIESAVASDVEVVADVLHADAVLVGDVAGYAVLADVVARVGVDDDVALQRGEEDEAVDGQDVAEERAVAAVLGELAGRGVVGEESLSERGDPDEAAGPLCDALDGGADVGAVACAAVERPERVLLAVVDAQSEGAAEPDVALVFEDGGDDVVLVAGLALHHVSEDAVLPSVEAVQSVVRAQPHESVAVAQSAEHAVVAQPVGRHVSLEHGCRLGRGHGPACCEHI